MVGRALTRVRTLVLFIPYGSVRVKPVIKKECRLPGKTLSIPVDKYASCFPGLARSTAGPHVRTVFAEGERGIPKGYNPLAAGGEIT